MEQPAFLRNNTWRDQHDPELGVIEVQVVMTVETIWDVVGEVTLLLAQQLIEDTEGYHAELIDRHIGNWDFDYRKRAIDSQSTVPES